MKPGNILLCNEDSLRIIDFNISKRVPLLFFNHKSKKNISMMSNRGSLEYLAPEMLQGFNEYSEQVDMWAAGVILYFILSGESPFQAEK